MPARTLAAATSVAAVLLLAQLPALAQQSPPSAALVDGALAVPGAPDTDMVPAKFSQKHAADDALITSAYTFKLLAPEQRRAIYQGLKDQPATPGLQAEIGTELPFTVGSRAVPDAVSDRVPQAKGYEYVVADNKVMLISPQTRFVVGVFSDVK